MIQSILFDLDGTLLDTAPDLTYALNQLLSLHQQPSLPLAVVRRCISEGSAGLIKLGFDIDETHKDFAALRQHLLTLYNECLGQETYPFNGIEEILSYLEQKQIPWGIVTNKLAVFTQALVKKLGLEHRAACVVSGDTTPYAKPHPAPLLHACTLLNCQPKNSLYIGDAERDIQAGTAAGMQTLAAAYGYLGSSDNPQNWNATGIINQPQDLIAWLDILK